MREGNEGSALVRDFLGSDGVQHSVVTRELPAFEHVNLQTAIDAWSAHDRWSSRVPSQPSKLACRSDRAEAAITEAYA